MQDIRKVVTPSAPLAPRQAPQAQPNPPKIKSPSGRAMGLKLLLMFGVPFLVLIAGLGGVFFGKADVNVKLRQQTTPFKFDFKVISEQSQEASASGPFVTGEQANEKYTDTKDFRSTGTGIFGTKSGGTIKFTTICNVAKKLPKSSRVLWVEGNKYYETQAEVMFEPAGTAGDTKSVDIFAEQIGAASNASDNQTWRTFNTDNCINGSSTPGTTTGGESHTGKKILQADVDKAIKSLQIEIFEKAKTDLKSKVDAEKVFLPELASFTVESFKSSPGVNKEGSKFNLELVLNVRVVVFGKKELEALLMTSIGDGSDKIISEIQNLTYVVNSKDEKTGFADLSSEGIAIQITEVDEVMLKESLNFKNEAGIIQEVGLIDGVDSVTVISHPSFIGFLPKQSSNITVTITR